MITPVPNRRIAIVAIRGPKRNPNASGRIVATKRNLANIVDDVCTVIVAVPVRMYLLFVLWDALCVGIFLQKLFLGGQPRLERTYHVHYDSEYLNYERECRPRQRRQRSLKCPFTRTGTRCFVTGHFTVTERNESTFPLPMIVGLTIKWRINCCDPHAKKPIEISCPWVASCCTRSPIYSLYIGRNCTTNIPIPFWPIPIYRTIPLDKRMVKNIPCSRITCLFFK